MKKIIFDEYYAEHILDNLKDYIRDNKDLQSCLECKEIIKKLEEFLK